MDSYEHAPGSNAARMRELGIRSGQRPHRRLINGCGEWPSSGRRGPAAAHGYGSSCREFAELLYGRITAAATRDELISPVGASSQPAMRRGGASANGVAPCRRRGGLGLQLRLAEQRVPPELGELTEHLSQIGSAVAELSEELREISHGLHPAALARAGLGPAIKALARRSTLPVTLDAAVPRRLPETVEVAAYYVVAEALTNAAKHAQASEVIVTVTDDAGVLNLQVRDNGIGGADFGNRSGLVLPNVLSKF
jgi:hypothetical protein